MSVLTQYRQRLSRVQKILYKDFPQSDFPRRLCDEMSNGASRSRWLCDQQVKNRLAAAFPEKFAIASVKRHALSQRIFMYN
jgi:hypothetical protein